MINPVRSLLLNENPGGEFSEPFDPGFVPVALKTGTSFVREMLVPTRFPARTRNFMATMWQRIASSHPLFGEIEKHVDRRFLITWEESHDSMASLTVATGTGADNLVISGVPSPVVSAGIFLRSWKLRKNTSSSIDVVDLDSGSTTTRDVTFNSDSSSVFSIESLSVRLLGVSSVPTMDVSIVSTCPFDFDLASVLTRCRTNSKSASVFSFRKSTFGPALLGEFTNGTRIDRALAALVIGFTIKAAEEAAFR